MQLRHLKTFAAVATTLNITRAAEQVHLAQSSVTEQIQALEADLGTALFDRSRRKLRLTEAGHRLLDYAGDMLSLADEARSAVADAAGLAAGTLIVGGLETLCATHLPPLLATFRARHPAVGVQLKVAGSGELRGGVRRGAIDLCFVFGALPSEPDLRGESVARENLVVIVPQGHGLAARNDAIMPNDLADEPFLVTETGCVYRGMFESAFPAARPGRPAMAGEYGSIAAIRRMVASGAGCALLPRLAVSDADGVVALPWGGEPDGVPIAMIWRRRRVSPPGLRLFLDAARESFAGLTPADARHRHAARYR